MIEIKDSIVNIYIYDPFLPFEESGYIDYQTWLADRLYIHGPVPTLRETVISC